MFTILKLGHYNKIYIIFKIKKKLQWLEKLYGHYQWYVLQCQHY